MKTSQVGMGTYYRTAGFRFALAITVVVLSFAGSDAERSWLTIDPTPALGGESPCLGDCDGNGQVTIGELVKGVNIALGQLPISACPAFDSNANGQASIDELVRAVTNALTDCGSNDPLNEGLERLAEGNLIAASGQFSTAVAAHPSDPAANLYFAVTRLATNVLDDPQLANLLTRGGYTISGGLGDVCAYTLTRPDEIPSSAPDTQEIIDTLYPIVVSELQRALDVLQQIPAEAVISFDLAYLPRCLVVPRKMGVVQIDRGDVLALTASLQGAAGLAGLLGGYDLDVDLHTLLDLSHRAIVASSPNLLALRSPEKLAAASESLRLAMSIAAQAISVILNETDGQGDDVLTIVPVDRDAAERLQQALEIGSHALDAEAVFPTSLGFRTAQRLNLSPLFSGQSPSLRGLLPGFDVDGDFDLHSFPDSRFGGMTPDLTPADIDEMIRGGPQCAVCQSDADCQSLGFLQLECLECSFDCTGTVLRCTDYDAECEDGYF